jgi:hypothetical protein
MCVHHGLACRTAAIQADVEAVRSKFLLKSIARFANQSPEVSPFR